MANQRRDYGRRADCVRRLIERLRSAEAGLRAAELAEASALPPEAGERILKRLALQGFARHLRDQWIPTRLLVRGACQLVSTRT